MPSGKNLNQPSRFFADINIRNNFKEITSQTKDLQAQILNLSKTAQFKIGAADDLVKMTNTTLKLNNALQKSENLMTGAFDLGKFNSELKQSGITIGEIKNTLTTLGPDGQRVFDSLASQIASAEVPLKRTSGMLSEMGTFLQNSFRWSVASGAINGLTREISKAFNYAQNLDKSLNSIQIVTGHSAEYMQNFAKQANEAAKTLNASTLEYTNAALIYYQQGLSDKEVAERTATTLKMAQVSGQSATKVSQQMTSIWNNFSNGVDNLERYADVMARLGATTASSSGEIAKGLEKFASISKTVGLSYDYAATAMATVTAQTRQSADSVGTSLKTLFSRLESLNLGKTLEDGVSLNKYSEALMKVGVNVLDANGKLKSMDTILDGLGQRWQTLTQAQQVALAQTVGGVRNYTTLVSLMENWDTFQENLITAQTADGTLQRQADIYADSWQAAQQRVQTSAQGIYNTLISSDFFKGLNNFTAGFLDTIGNMGKTLGTSGSVSSLGALATYMFQDQIANGIDNAIHNIGMSTASGRAIANQSKIDTLFEIGQDISTRDNIFDKTNGSILDSLKQSWQKFGDANFTSQAQRELVESQLLLAQTQAIEASSTLNNLRDSAQSYHESAVNFRQIVNGISNTDFSIGETIQKSIEKSASEAGLVGDFYKTFESTFNKLGKQFNDQISTTGGSRQQQLAKDTAKDIQRYIDNITNGAQKNALQKAFSGTTYNGQTIQQILASGGELTDDQLGALRQVSLNANEAFDRAIGDILKDKKLSFTSNDFKGGAKGQAWKEYQKQQDKSNVRSDVLNAKGKAKLEAREAIKNFGSQAKQIEQDKYQAATIGEKTRERVDAAGRLIPTTGGNQPSAIGSWLRSGPNQARNAEGLLGFKHTENGITSTYYAADKQDPNDTIAYATQSVGQFAIGLGMAAQSTVAAVSSIDNFAKSVKDGTATMGGLVTTLGSSAFAVGQLSNVLGNKNIITGFNNVAGPVSKALGSGFDKIGWTGLGTAEGLTGAGIGITAAALAATAATIYEGIKNTTAQSLENKIIRSNELSIQATATSKESTKKFDAFESVIKDQIASANKLSTLQQGTASYTSQLLAANEQARNIIETYNLQPGKDYTVDEEGITRFSGNQLTDIYERVEQQAKDAATNAVLMGSAKSQLTNLNSINDLSDKITNKIVANRISQDTLNANYTDLLEGKVSDQVIEELRAYDTLSNTNYTDQLISTASQIQELKTLNQADYQATINSLLASQDGLTDKERLIARALGANGEENVTQWQSILSQRDTNGSLLGFHWTDDGQVFDKDGNTLKRSWLDEQYKAKYGAASNTNNMSDMEVAVAIRAAIYREGLQDQIDAQAGLLNNISDSTLSRFANAGNLSRDDFNSLIEEGFRNISRTQYSAANWDELTDEQKQIMRDYIENTVFGGVERNWRDKITGGTEKFETALEKYLKQNPEATAEDFIEARAEKFYNSLGYTEKFQTIDKSQGYQLLTSTALKEYAKSVDDLAKTVTQNTLIDSQNFADLLQTSNASNNQLQLLNAYTSTMGNTFGEVTGKYVFDALTSNDNDLKTPRNWNQQFFDALNKLNLENSITGLASLKQQEKLLSLGDEKLTPALQKLEQAIREDIANNGGYARTAFNTSDFAQVQNAIASALADNTNITTGDIAKMAKKNSTLASYLDSSEDGIKHYQSVIDIGEMLAAGQITTADLTDGFVKGIEIGGGVSDFQQAGLDTLAEQNLGNSYGEIDDYWQNIGKSWAVATKENMGHDTPFFNAMQSFLTDEQFAQFRNLMESSSPGSTVTKDINKTLKEQMRPVYDLLSTTAGTGKYFGKGGGGIETAFAYFGQMFGDQMANQGIVFDPETGNISFNSNFGQAYTDYAAANGLTNEVTSIGLYGYLQQAFENLSKEGYTYSDKQIETFSKQIVGYLGSTDFGYVLDVGNAAEQLTTTLKEFNKEGFAYGNVIDALSGAFDSGILQNLVYDTTQGIFRELTDEEKQNGITKDGVINFTTEDGLKNAFTQALSSQGTVIVGKATEGFSNLTQMGKRLADQSYGTLTPKTQDDAGYQQVVKDVLDSVVSSYTREYYQANSGAGSGGYYLLDNNTKYYDFDELKTFFTENQGYTPGDADKAIKALIDSGTDVVKTYTDAYGRQHNVSTYNEDTGGRKSGESYYNEMTDQDQFGEEAFTNRALENMAAELAERIDGKTYTAADAARDFNSYREELFKQEKESREDNFVKNPEDNKNRQPSQNDKENTEKENDESTSEISNPTGPISEMSQNDIDTIRGDYTHGYVNDNGDYVYVGPDGTTYRAVDLNAREEYLKEHPTAETEQTQSERQQQASEWEKDLQKQLESYREDITDQIINPMNGKEMTEQEAEALAKDLHQIAENTGTSAELQEALNDAVGEGKAPGLTGEETEGENGAAQGAEDENATELNLPGTEQSQSSGTDNGGDGGGDSGNQPDDQSYVGNGNGNGDGSSTNMSDLDQRIQDAFANTTAGSTVTVNGTDDNGNTTTTTYTNNGDGTVSTETHTVIDDTKASGQNNNLLPHFAAGIGTIAVTGELGPELHVKPNGDMDLLGKHGREYAWVEPDDKIYTAAQTASILGSKKIREMINGFSSGINNFIPGYASAFDVGNNSYGTQLGSSSSKGGGDSGGGWSGFGGGGGIGQQQPDLTAENHRFDANWIKYRDILERYYTILQQLEDLSIELQRFATLADRAWGRSRIDNIEKTIAVQEQQVVAQRAYLSEINTYLKEDKKQVTDTVKEFADQWNEMYPNRPLTFDGATFDQNGVLTNYRQIVETMLDAYNMDVGGYAYASGNYSVGAAGQGGQGLYSTIASAVAQGVTTALGGAGSIGRISITKSDGGSYTAYASGQNNNDAQTAITSLSYKVQENSQQSILEEQLKDIQFYTQTLNLYQQQLTVLEQMEQQLFDTRLQAIQVEVDYKVSIKNNALNLLDYALAKVKDDAYMAAEAVSLIGQEQDINISILEDYEQELKDILNLNLNGEQFFGGDDYQIVPTMDLSQIEKDLKKLDKLHEKFWDEETQTYRDHYIENTKTGEITFDNSENKEDDKNKLSLVFGGTKRNSSSIGSAITGEQDGNLSLFDENGISKTDENLKRHSINEYSSLVARMYEKYYANYSQYLPDPEEFLNYTNSKKRLEALKKQEEEAAAAAAAASIGGSSVMNSNGSGSIVTNIVEGYLNPGMPRGRISAEWKYQSGTDMTMGSTGTNQTGGAGNDLPDYLYIIRNAGDAVDQLSKLSDLLNSHTIHADIDKFTSKFKNMGSVSSQLQDILDGLTDDFPKLGQSIEDTNSDLIHFDKSANKWLLDIDSYTEAMEVLEQLNKANRQKLTDERFEQFKEDPMAFWEWMTDMSENFDFTNFTANEIQMLNQLSTNYLSSIANLKNSVLTQIDYLGNSVKAYAKDMDTVFNEFDHYKNLYADWQNIIDLTGRQATKISHDLIVELNTNVVDNAINKLKSAREQLDAMTHMQSLAQAQYLQAQAELEAFEGDDEQRYWLQNIVDEYKANIDKINKETEEAEDAYMKSWEDALQGLATAFQQAIKDAAAGFEESFSPIYHTFDALSGALERQRNLRDLYLRPYDQAHGLSQMARDIKDSILDTDNLNSKRELKKLLDEVNDAQEEGVELSAYDLDIMQKKYDLELARQALEDAKNAKSLVRLARDNNGNWSYVYTANEDDIDEAEQRYEDAILAMEQTNENYIDSLQDQLLQVLANAEASIAALNPSDFANEAEYIDRVEEIQNLANAQIAFIQEQMENAFANNNYLLDNVAGKAADIMQDLTTSYDNTLLAMLTSSDSIGALAALSVDNVGSLADQAMQAYHDFWTRNAEVWQEAGHDISDASTTISEAMDTISQDSIDNVGEMSKVVDRAVDAFDRLNEVLVINAGKIYDVVANYETLAASINKIIELSGEYIKKNTITIDANINSWSQLEDIYSKLATDGSVWIKYLDENDEEQIKFLEAGTKDTMDWLSAQREQLANLLQHEVAKQAIFDSQKELDSFIKDLTSTIKEKGLIKLDIKGELFNKIIGVNDTNKDIYDHWKNGTLEDYAAMFGGSEKMKEQLSTENRAIMEFFENLDKLAKENGDYKPDQTGVIKLDWVNDQAGVNHILELLKALLEVKKEEVRESSGGSSDSGGDWYEKVIATNTYDAMKNEEGSSFSHIFGDTGMYTGRWQSMDTGGYSGNWYTGEWPNGSVRRNGRLAWLHQKELVLNAHDTENFLDAMEIVRQLDNLTNWMANGLGMLAPTNVESDEEILQQEVHITAEFPNVTNHSEIEEAFNNLNNLASQYVHRR